MKISEIKIDVIEREHKKINVIDERQTLGGKTTQGVLRIITDNGIEGNALIGEQGSNSLDRIMIIHKIIKPKLLGMDVSHREWLWSQVGNISGHGLPLVPAEVVPLSVNFKAYLSLVAKDEPVKSLSVAL